MDALLAAVDEAATGVAAAQVGDLAAKREVLAGALSALLLKVAKEDLPESVREPIDAKLAARAAELKGALLKALRECALHRAFLGLPKLMEEMRRLLTACPAKGVASYLEVALCEDISQCNDARALICVQDVLQAMEGKGKLKKELCGFELSAPAKKSVRTAANRASRRFTEVEKSQRESAQREGGIRPKAFHMDRDVRLEDVEQEEARYSACVAGLDNMFGEAMERKNRKAEALKQ